MTVSLTCNGGTCVFISCNFVNQTPTFNQTNPLNVQVQRCFGIPSSTISNCTFAGLNTLSNSPYNTVLNEPIINIPGTGQYALPTNTPTSGYVIQATGTTTSAWMLPSGGIPSGQGTAAQVLVNNTFGSPQTGALTFALPSTLIAPGTIQATTSLTTPALSMAGSGYTYQLPVTTGSAPSNGLFLQYQSAGGGQCVWAAGGGGGGISSVAGSSVSTGLDITTTSGAVTIGWDVSQPAAFPSSASFNNLGVSGTQFTLPLTGGAPGYYLTWPDTGDQLIWSAFNVTQILGTPNQISASTPSSGVVILSFPATQIFPGSLATSGSVTASTSISVTDSNPQSFWPSHLPTAPGGLLTSSTSGALSWTNFAPVPTTSSATLTFTYGGSAFENANATFSLAANGQSVNVRVSLANMQNFTCDNTIVVCISTIVHIPSTYAPAGNIGHISLGYLPIYNVTDSQLYYGKCFLVQPAPGNNYYMAFVLGDDTNTGTSYSFTSGKAYSFGIDNDISGIGAVYASFNYPINITI